MAAREGRHTLAAECISKAILLRPDVAQYHSHLGNVLQEQRCLEAAASAHRRAIALAPNGGDFHYNLGNALALQRRYDEAASCYRRAIDLNPVDAKAHASLGTLCAQRAQWAAAEELYRAALRLQPGLADVRANLGGVLRQQGRLAEAIDVLREAAALKPADPFALCDLASALREHGQSEEAAACYRRAVDIAPRVAELQNTLGNVLRAHGMLDAAIDCYRRAIDLRPNFPEAYNNLGVALQQQGDLDAAADSYRQAIALKPDLFGAHANLGIILQERCAWDAAIACYRRSIAIKPDFAEGYSNLGIALQETGALEAAYEAFETAIRIAPRRGAFHRMLAITGRMRRDSSAFHRLEALAENIASLPEPDQIEVHFALGAVYAEADEPAKSSFHLLAGNRLKRARTPYNEDEVLAVFRRIETVFTGEMLAARRGCGMASRLPIFIVGMPRSGTTLVEQILASHPQIAGAGELMDLPRLVDAVGADAASTFPEWVASAPDDRITHLGHQYLDILRRHAGSALHVVDKMPENFLRIGLIQLAFPDARIIHVERDPLDTCLSCFSKLFTNNLPYTYDLGELARYYRAYTRLMAHWQQALPPGTILNVRYEDVVSGLEGQARRMVAYCDLPWDSACLQFHQNRRAVRTSSVTQVRQPLYAHAVGRWHAFTDLVQTLREVLEAADVW
jgi:tetratricopeptide (TPR) repeat protein